MFLINILREWWGMSAKQLVKNCLWLYLNDEKQNIETPTLKVNYMFNSRHDSKLEIHAMHDYKWVCVLQADVYDADNRNPTIYINRFHKGFWCHELKELFTDTFLEKTSKEKQEQKARFIPLDKL